MERRRRKKGKKMSDIQVDKKNNVVKLIVDTRFYGCGAVLSAAKAYTDSCWVYVDGDTEDKLLVTLKPKTDEIKLETLGYEFYNFMLGLMQNAYSEE